MLQGSRQRIVLGLGRRQSRSRGRELAFGDVALFRSFGAAVLRRYPPFLGLSERFACSARFGLGLIAAAFFLVSVTKRAQVLIKPLPFVLSPRQLRMSRF